MKAVKTQKVYCCGCTKVRRPRLTDGTEIYPHRSGLNNLMFYVCDECGNFVGCHKETKKPLGSIPTPALREARTALHLALAPLGVNKKEKRDAVYKNLSNLLGYPFDISEIRNPAHAGKLLVQINKFVEDYA
jgi:hypothetical protein